MKPEDILSREFATPFIFSVKDIFKAQFSLILKNHGAQAVESGSECKFAVGCFIDIKQPGMRVWIALYYSDQLARFAYEGWAGEAPEAIDDDVSEVLREILNMVYGQAKSVIKDLTGLDLPPLLPTSMVGDDLKAEYHLLKPALAVPFYSSQGECQIEIGIAKD